MEKVKDTIQSYLNDTQKLSETVIIDLLIEDYDNDFLTAYSQELENAVENAVEKTVEKDINLKDLIDIFGYEEWEFKNKERIISEIKSLTESISKL